jgi:O-succinylbenzoic acid--CoA ligase
MTSYKWDHGNYIPTAFEAKHFDDESSFVFLNSKLSINEEFHKLPYKASRLWFLTSGSTGEPKWVAIQKKAFLKSAHSVNTFFDLTSQDVFVKSLPLFHVGGLAILARAHLLKAKVVALTQDSWDPKSFLNFIVREKVTVLSLVPTQLFDLIKLNINAPKTIRLAFIGGGAVSLAVIDQAVNLGWPVIPSYGMTETSSMIAAVSPEDRNTDQYQQLTVLPHAQIKVGEDGVAYIRATSAFEGIYTVSSKTFNEHENGEWIKTTDQIDLSKEGKIVSVSRISDSVKVNGELVSLNVIEGKLKSHLKDDLLSCDLKVVALPNDRTENEITLCLKSSDWPQVYNSLNKARTKLSSIEQPRRLILLLDWPVNEMGKWNHKNFLKTLNFD